MKRVKSKLVHYRDAIAALATNEQIRQERIDAERYRTEIGVMREQFKQGKTQIVAQIMGIKQSYYNSLVYLPQTPAVNLAMVHDACRQTLIIQRLEELLTEYAKTKNADLLITIDEEILKI